MIFLLQILILRDPDLFESKLIDHSILNVLNHQVSNVVIIPLTLPKDSFCKVCLLPDESEIIRLLMMNRVTKFIQLFNGRFRFLLCNLCNFHFIFFQLLLCCFGFYFLLIILDLIFISFNLDDGIFFQSVQNLCNQIVYHCFNLTTVI